MVSHKLPPFFLLKPNSIFKSSSYWIRAQYVNLTSWQYKFGLFYIWYVIATLNTVSVLLHYRNCDKHIITLTITSSAGATTATTTSQNLLYFHDRKAQSLRVNPMVAQPFGPVAHKHSLSTDRHERKPLSYYNNITQLNNTVVYWPRTISLAHNNLDGEQCRGWDNILNLFNTD